MTGNIAHFERLADTSDGHYGVIAMPPGGTREKQLECIKSALAAVPLVDDEAFRDMFAYVEDERVRLEQRSKKTSSK